MIHYDLCVFGQFKIVSESKSIDVDFKIGISIKHVPIKTSVNDH